MSYKYAVEKHSNNHYVLPKVGNMKVDVHAFLSEKLYNLSEENMWQQIVNGASYEGVIGAYLLPDCHLGYGVPVGSCIVTEDTIIQASVGYDINCGILSIKVPGLTAKDIVDQSVRRAWINEVEKRVATGVGSNRPSLMPKFSSKKIDDVLRYGAKAINVKADICERQYIPVDDNVDLHKIQRAYDKAIPQLGSVGSGNHYIELQVDSITSEVWVMIHCGSRGYGYQTADHFFYESAQLRGIAKNQRESSWLRIDEDLGKEYWNYHNTAANYAIVNRHIIVNGVQEALQEIFKCTGEVFYEISHNLIQKETIKLPDGSFKKGFVHRKGATRAFPAGHPDLVDTIWKDTGHPTLIPGSMFDGAAILFPADGAYKSGCSVNHGSGRLLGRGVAKKTLDQTQINQEMQNVVRKFGDVEIHGILTNSRDTPLDECKHVYKNLDDVLSVLTEEGIATISNRLYPVANLKGID